MVTDIMHNPTTGWTATTKEYGLHYITPEHAALLLRRVRREHLIDGEFGSEGAPHFSAYLKDNDIVLPEPPPRKQKRARAQACNPQPQRRNLLTGHFLGGDRGG